MTSSASAPAPTSASAVAAEPHLRPDLAAAHSGSPSDAVDRSADLAREPDDHDGATIVGIVLALVLGGLYALARFPVGVDWHATLVAIGSALLLVALPGVWPAARRSPASPAAPRPLAFHVWPTLLGLAALCGGASISTRTGIALGVPLAALGGVCGAVVAGRWVVRRPLLATLAFLLPAGLLGVWAAGLSWGAQEYMHPLAVERLLAGFRLHPDTLFHAGVAHVWQTYGVPANGVDGVRYLAYHFGSHWLITRLGELAGVDPLRAYQLVYPVVLLPWLFTSLLRFAIDVRPLLARGARWAPAVSAPLFWLVLLGVCVGVAPAEWVEEIGSSYRKPVLSQSYTLGLTLALLLGSVVIWLRSHEGAGRSAGALPARPSPARPAGALVVLWLVVPVLTTSLGFAKISLMGLAIGVQLYLLVRLGLYRSPRHLVALALVLAGAVGAHLLTNPAHSSGMGALLPIRAQAYQLLWIAKNYFVPVHLAWTLLYVVLRLHGEGVRRWADLRRRFLERRLLDVEILLVVTVLGLGPTVVLETGGNGYYFSDVQRWLAAGLLLGGVALVDQRWRERWSARGGRGVHPAVVAGVALALSAVTALALNTALPTLRFLRQTFELRAALASPAPPRDEAVAFLIDVARRPATERAAMLLYVPRSVRAYWDRPDEPCWGIPFLAPAVGGVALLDGLPSAPCAQPGYGYAAFGALERPAERADLTPLQICQAADERGFRRVLVVAGDGDGRLIGRELTCPPAPASAPTPDRSVAGSAGS